jgi:hypothetical protein
MDADGANIFFATGDPLLSNDTDGGQIDIYDARVDGGFPAAKADAACGDVGCEGSVAAPPLFDPPLSTTTTSVGNLLDLPTVAGPSAAEKPKACSKGRRPSHGKCVVNCPKSRRRLSHARCISSKYAHRRKVAAASVPAGMRGAR